MASELLVMVVQMGSRMIPNCETQEVDFIGGPLDGHSRRFTVPIKSFVIVQSFAHTLNTSRLALLFRVLFFYEHLYPFVLAVYELRSGGYRFRQSTTATELHVDPTFADTIVQDSSNSCDLRTRSND